MNGLHLNSSIHSFMETINLNFSWRCIPSNGCGFKSINQYIWYRNVYCESVSYLISNCFKHKHRVFIFYLLTPLDTALAISLTIEKWEYNANAISSLKAITFHIKYVCNVVCWTCARHTWAEECSFHGRREKVENILIELSYVIVWQKHKTMSPAEDWTQWEK